MSNVTLSVYPFGDQVPDSMAVNRAYYRALDNLESRHWNLIQAVRYLRAEYKRISPTDTPYKRVYA